MANGNAALMYLLLRERERELARATNLDRLRTDDRDATGRRPSASRLPTSPWRFGLARLTRRALTGA